MRCSHCQMTCLHSTLMHKSWALYLAGGKQPELTELSRLAPWLLERRCPYMCIILSYIHILMAYICTIVLYTYTLVPYICTLVPCVCTPVPCVCTPVLCLHTSALGLHTSALGLHTRAMNTDCSNDALPAVPAQRIRVRLLSWPASLPHAKTAQLT